MIIKPTIFSPTLSNKPELLICKINNVAISCITDPQNPYRLQLHESPITIGAGKEFNVTVYGLSMPSASSTGATAKTQTGFFGLSSQNQVTKDYGNYYTE